MRALPWPPQPQPRPLRRRLLTLALAATVPLALIAGIGAAAMLDDQQQRAERATLDLTRAFATAVEAELGRSLAVLSGLATSPQLDGGDVAGFRERAQRVLHTLPDWRAIILAEPDGRVVAHTSYPPGVPMPPVVEKQSFERAIAERQPIVGLLSAGPRGEWGVAVRLPVERNSQPKYVLSGVLRPEAILKVLERQRVPGDWVISVFDARQARIARTRGHESSVGGNPAPQLKTMMDSPAPEGLGETLTIEGQRVHTAYVRLPESGWTVAAGLPTDEVEKGLYRAMAAYAAAIVLSVLVAAWLALLLARRIDLPIAELREAARALGRGDPPRKLHSDIVEVNEVADTLLEAAHERARSEAEREALLAAERRAREEAEAARAQAESANRAKDEFLAMLGHELRNPLAPIVTALELMKLRHAGVAEQERGVIERQVRHLARLVDDLLDVARIAQGKVKLDMRRLDLRYVLDKALELSQPAFAGRRPLESRRPDDPVWVEGDEVRLAQVVANLLSNAAKFTPADRAVHLDVSVEGGHAVLNVSDEGMGIAPGLLPHVFELFVQGEQALDRRSGGLGLGLGIVKMLVEMHRGSVTAESAGPGGGSRFTVRLPLARPPAVASDAPPATAELQHAGAVLLVDDNVDAAQSLAEVLRLQGYEVRVVHDAKAALEAIDDFVPDVALLDIGLPGMNGYELAAALRADPRLLQLVLIAITGYGREPDRARALAAHFDEHFVKPVDIEALLEAMGRRIGQG